jgi:hypothetical protein
MKKLIPKGNLSRYSKLIIDAGNLTNCYEETGVHYATIKKIIKTGFASQAHIAKLNAYCDEVESVNA